MKTLTATLKSISPYQQGRHYTDPKKQGESSHDHEVRTWRERMHVNEQGNVYIPPMAFKNSLSEAAKFLSINIPGKGKSQFTKHFEAGVLVTDPLVLPVKKEAVEGQWLFLPANGVRGHGKRVDKCFPTFPNWTGEVVYHVFDETVLTTIQTPEGQMTAFEHVLKQSGSFIGIGVFRPRNNGFYGRFVVTGIKGL